MNGCNWFDIFMVCYIGLAIVLIIVYAIISIYERHRASNRAYRALKKVNKCGGIVDSRLIIGKGNPVNFVRMSANP